MARVTGTAGEVTITGGTVAGIKSWTINYVADTQESTAFDSTGVGSYLGTITHWSGSFEGYKDGAPVAIGGAAVAGVFKETQTATQKWSGNIIITGITPKTDIKSLVTYAYTFQGTGVLTVPTT